MLFLFKLEQQLSIQRFDVYHIKHTDNVHKFMLRNQDHIITLYDMSYHKERALERFKQKDYKSIMIRIYKGLCPGIFHCNDSTRKWDPIQAKMIRYVIINKKYLQFLIELKLRLNQTHLDHIINYVYDTYKECECILNNVYERQYECIKDI